MSGMRLLRACLLFSAAVWGVSILGVFATWSTALEALQGLGAGDIPHDRMLDYWLRMTAGAFTLVGGLFLVLAFRPQKYWNVIPWFGGFMLIEGLIIAIHGLRLSLPPFPFYGDVSACVLGGLGILFFWSREDKTMSAH